MVSLMCHLSRVGGVIIHSPAGSLNPSWPWAHGDAAASRQLEQIPVLPHLWRLQQCLNTAQSWCGLHLEPLRSFLSLQRAGDTVRSLLCLLGSPCSAAIPLQPIPEDCLALSLPLSYPCLSHSPPSLAGVPGSSSRHQALRGGHQRG